MGKELRSCACFCLPAFPPSSIRRKTIRQGTYYISKQCTPPYPDTQPRHPPVASTNLYPYNVIPCQVPFRRDRTAQCHGQNGLARGAPASRPLPPFCLESTRIRSLKTEFGNERPCLPRITDSRGKGQGGAKKWLKVEDTGQVNGLRLRIRVRLMKVNEPQQPRPPSPPSTHTHTPGSQPQMVPSCSTDFPSASWTCHTTFAPICLFGLAHVCSRCHSASVC